jgi:hypothetical protein
MTTLAVVLAQYDRTLYKDALPRLMTVVDGLCSADSTVVVVDNREEGPWSHTVSGRLHHIGGDNSAWEFSAFDRGIAWLTEQGLQPDVYTFVTDAFLRYGDDYLDLIDDHVLDWCQRLDACIGWVDSFMETCTILDLRCDAWLRTSFVFMPASALARLTPLAVPLDDAAIFGTTAQEPFLPEAPVSENLRALILEWLTSNPLSNRRGDDVWHSRFELDQETFAFFKDKAKAILRELLLSARIREAGIAAYDYRFLRRLLEDAGADRPPREDDLRGMQWLGWLYD